MIKDLEILSLLFIFIFPVVFIIVGTYFKNNIRIEIGKSGYVTKKSTESKETWIYAQIIAPKIILKIAVVCAIFNLLLAFVMLIAHCEYKMIVDICSLVGFFFVFVLFFIVDKKLEDFQSSDLFKVEDNRTREKWLNLVKVLITKKQISKIDDTIRDCKVREKMLKEYGIK